MSVVLFQDDGQTALMYAARYGHLEICRLLIDTGCKIVQFIRLVLMSVVGYVIDGYTALHYAAWNAYLLITRCLVEQGASPLVKSLEGQTPYDLAAKGMNGQYKEVMKYLQTVMSEKSSGVTAKQGREGNFY
ncbi:ankyrin repeat domain-containing protein 6-like [Mytilus trossulus]|uniref:ankyrin repeat domain-containing protein 6-like n=1 Tax=Mytilus trossulus TaxID=6551 RepID=UPI003004C8DF